MSPAQAAFAALAVAGSAEGRDEAARVAREILAGFRDRPGALLQAALPLALLARELDGGRMLDGPRAPANGAGAACAADIRRALAALAVQLAPQQVGADPANPDGLPADLVGGLMPPSGPRARVDAECLRHGAALAIAFAGGAPEVPDGGDAMVRRFVRFLAQHTAADPWVGGFRRPDAIRGLVRGSLATDDCPPEATAFGVLLSAAAADRAAVGR